MKDSMKNALLTLGALIFGGLVLVFMAVPNVSAGGTLGGTSGTLTEWSGFSFYENGTDFMKAMLVITAIIACLVVILGVVKLITDSKLCKSKSIANIVSLLFKVMAIALLVSSVLYMIAVITMCNDGSFDLGDFLPVSGGLSPVYWSIILMVVFALVSTGCALFSGTTSKKKK